MSEYIFLDRDGTLNEDYGYVHRIEDLKIIHGVIEGLKRLQNLGYKFIVVTNQGGIAAGHYELCEAVNCNNELEIRLKKEGINIQKFYLCSHHPKYSGPCECRKPEIGMVQMAAREFGLDPADCIYVGDKDSDIQLGKNCKGTTVRIKNQQYPNTVQADFEVDDLEQLASILSYFI